MRALSKELNPRDFEFVQPSKKCGGGMCETSSQFLGSHLKQPKLHQQPAHKPTTSIKKHKKKKKRDKFHGRMTRPVRGMGD